MPKLIDTALTRHENRYAQAIQVGGSKPSGDAEQDETAAAGALAAKLPAPVAGIEPDAIAPSVVFLASNAAA